MKKFILILIGILTVSSGAFAASQTFKMYSEPNAPVNTSCDVYTKLVLDTNGDVGTATLSNHLSGICTIVVPERKRSYQVALSDTSCGTKIYRQNEDADEAIEVADNRSRFCEDIIPALIVLKEYDNDGNETVLYSADN